MLSQWALLVGGGLGKQVRNSCIWSNLPSCRLFQWGAATTSQVGEWTVALTTLGGLERTVVREKQEFCWGSTISACKTGRQWMAAADLFHAMFARALKVDIVSSTATAAAAVDTWPLAMSVLGRARDARMAMDE
ncbi:unnamed protein product, partial [Effrenium voratum]